ANSFAIGALTLAIPGSRPVSLQKNNFSFCLPTKALAKADVFVAKVFPPSDKNVDSKILLPPRTSNRYHPPMPRIFAIALLLCLSQTGILPQPATNVSTTATARRRETPVYSPQIAEDGKVTFRLRAPAAQEVKLSGEWSGNTEPLTKGDEGVWSITVGPLKPEIYGYAFIVDGVRMPDPGNARLKPMR